METKKMYEILMDENHEDHEKIYSRIYESDLEAEALWVVHPEEIFAIYYEGTDGGIISWEKYSNSKICETEVGVFVFFPSIREAKKEWEYRRSQIPAERADWFADYWGEN